MQSHFGSLKVWSTRTPDSAFDIGPGSHGGPQGSGSGGSSEMTWWQSRDQGLTGIGA